MKYSIAIFSSLIASIYFLWSGDSWPLYDFFRLLTTAIVSYVLWMEVSYSKLMLKTAAFIVFIDSAWNLLQFYMHGSLQKELELLNAIILIPWFVWALSRHYEAQSVPIEGGKVYWIANIPKTLTGFITSLFGEPLGGYSLYMDGRLYGYHIKPGTKRGVFDVREMSSDRLKVHAIESDIKESREVTQWLQNMEGVKWGAWNNCISFRLKVWWRYGR